MSIFSTKTSRLTRLFELAGADDPESWAKSEVDEGIPQLARFLFLRQAWRQVVADGDVKWIDREIQLSKRSPDAPGAGLGLSLSRLLSSGASREDLTELARAVQWQLLHGLCYQLSDPAIEEPELSDVGWGLFEVIEDGKVGRPIEGLHESVLETDPTGREMRPKDAV
ncbi:MAG TPA: hypothetical protein VHB46_17140 [Burkholderiales bacterium]|nr:hypothetical protein [Burkholderiales bacterium]